MKPTARTPAPLPPIDRRPPGWYAPSMRTQNTFKFTMSLRPDLVARLDTLADVISDGRGGARVSRLDLVREAVSEYLDRRLDAEMVAAGD